MDRIKAIQTRPAFKLLVSFDDGQDVLFDVKPAMKKYPGYDDLKNIKGLFEQVQIDSSRTVVFWNDYIDFSADQIRHKMLR